MTIQNATARLTVIVLTAILSLAGLTMASTTPAMADPTDPEVVASPSVKVLSITPTTVGPDDDVTVEVELTNPTTEPLDAVDLTLSIVRYRLSTDAILENWFTGIEEIVTPLDVASISLDEPLQAGESRKLKLKTPASDLRLLPFPDAAGPRGLIVTATDSSTRRELDTVRTFLLWYPTDDVEPLRLSILTPIVGPFPTPNDSETWGQHIADVTGSAGRLNALLAVTAEERDITWAVDPELIRAATDGTAGDSGALWAESFSQATTGRDVFALPPFDQDVAALAAADLTPPPINTDFAPIDAWRDDLTLPATDVIDQTTLSDAVAADRPNVVLNQGLTPLIGEQPILNAAATVPTEAGPATVLLPDAELSELFANPSTAGLNSTFEVRQLLLARLAIIAEKNPESAQHVLLTTDRYWHPDTGHLKIMLDGITDARFIETEPLSRLLGTRILETSAEAAPAVAEPDPTQITSADLAKVLAKQQQINTLASAVADPEVFTEDFRRSFAAVTSSIWRTDISGRNTAIKELSEYADELLDGVSIVPGSDLNLISDRGDLPVTVQNSLDQDLTIEVALVPDDQRLSIKDAVTVTIPAKSAQAVDIPATAIGSGDVSVEVQVLAPDGTLIAAPSNFNVRVRADWENVGTAVLASTLAIALAFGVIRTIRRGKRPTRMEPVHPPSSTESTP